MSSLRSKYWAGSFISMVIGVSLLAFSHKVSGEHTRFLAFSSGAFFTSGLSQIIRNLVEEGDRSESK